MSTYHNLCSPAPAKNGACGQLSNLCIFQLVFFWPSKFLVYHAYCPGNRNLLNALSPTMHCNVCPSFMIKLKVCTHESGGRPVYSQVGICPQAIAKRKQNTKYGVRHTVIDFHPKRYLQNQRQGQGSSLLSLYESDEQTVTSLVGSHRFQKIHFFFNFHFVYISHYWRQ